MSLFSKLKNTFAPKFEPLVCRPSDIFDLIEDCVAVDAPLCRLIVEINGRRHRIGVTSDYDGRTRKYFDIAYYFDDNEFPSLGELTDNVKIDGKRFAELETITVIEDEDSGDPRNNVLLTDRELK